MDNQIILITARLGLAKKLHEDLNAQFPELTIEVISNKERALKALTRNFYEIYLLDQQQEQGTGIEWLEVAINQGCTGSIIFIGQNDDPDLDKACFKLGADDYISWENLTPALLERKIRFTRRRIRNSKLLLAQQERYRALFHQSTNPIFIANQDLQLLEFNEAMGSLMGLDNIQRIKLNSLFKNKKRFDTLQNKLNEQTIIHDFEVSLVNGKKHHSICSLSMVRLDEGFDLSHTYLGILYDLTAFKQAQRHSERSKILSISEKFTRMIAHEIRNPLTNINLSVQQLVSDFQEDIVDDIPFYADIIQRNTTRINELISNMLQTSKPINLNIGRFGLRQLILDALAKCMDRIELLDIECEISTDSSDLQLEVDKEKFSIAVVNVIINAIEAMKDVKSPKLTIKWEPIDESLVKLTIADNGKGMDEAELGKIFEPFYTGKSSGIGLGMTTTLNILKSHEAKVDVESVVGKGTKFTILMQKQLSEKDRKKQLIL